MRSKITKLVESGLFTVSIFILITLNTLTLGIETFKLSPAATSALNVFNVFCITVFVLEILLKLYAYGLSFFKDGWNIFDVIIVVISLLPMIKFLSSMRAFRIFRIFRAFRALRVMKQLEKLRVIVQAILAALPSVAWVVVLLLIIYYIFAVIGTNLFSTISPEYFGNLGKSAYSLFQITMADDIGNISRPLLASAGASAVIYFVSFVALSSILVLNVIVGVVVDSMEEVKTLTHTVHHENKKNKTEEPQNTKETKNNNEELIREIRNLEQQLDKMKTLISKNMEK